LSLELSFLPKVLFRSYDFEAMFLGEALEGLKVWISGDYVICICSNSAFDKGPILFGPYRNGSFLSLLASALQLP